MAKGRKFGLTPWAEVPPLSEYSDVRLVGDRQQGGARRIRSIRDTVEVPGRRLVIVRDVRPVGPDRVGEREPVGEVTTLAGRGRSTVGRGVVDVELINDDFIVAM